MLDRRNGDVFWRASHDRLKRLYLIYMVDFDYVNFEIIFKNLGIKVVTL